MDLEKLSLPLEVADKAFNAGIAGAVAGVTALVGAMGVAVKATFDWAAQLDSIQDIIGGTNEQAAALNFTLRKSGVGTDTFTKSMTILNKGLVKADGSLDTTGKGLQEWGIRVKNINGTLRGTQGILADVSVKYNELGTQQERVNFLTEVFGRGGAEMIDFFDTLAAEGGIEAVTSKVERLGLVVDPGRYEQFTRSLEELKLVGLGLAVGFTEKVMPAFERFLEIVTGEGTLGQKAGALAANFDAFVGNAIGNMAVAVENWVAGGGPEELSAKLISWIENIGEGDQSRIMMAAEKLVKALGTALANVDWAGIAIAIDTKLAELFDSIDFAGGGASFGAGIDQFFATGFNDGIESLKSVQVPASITSLLDGINNFFLAAVGADKFGGWEAYFTVWGKQLAIGFIVMVQNYKIEFTNFWNNIWTQAVTGISEFWEKWKTAWTSKVSEWGTTVYNAVMTQVNKIIMAFNKIPILPNVAPIPMLSAGNSTSPGRASGGAVIKGQTYNVSEFYKPEKFTPTTNGRIDPLDNGGDMMTTLQIMLQQFADEIGRSNRVAFEKAGRR